MKFQLPQIFVFTILHNIVPDNTCELEIKSNKFNVLSGPYLPANQISTCKSSYQVLPNPSKIERKKEKIPLNSKKQKSNPILNYQMNLCLQLFHCYA